VKRKSPLFIKMKKNKVKLIKTGINFKKKGIVTKTTLLKSTAINKWEEKIVINPKTERRT
jgi:hypothetical protein